MKDNISKIELRNYFKNLKKEISKEDKQNWDQKIADNILKMKAYKKADIIMAYLANEIEANIDVIIKDALRNNKKVALPKSKKDGQMDFYFIDNLSEVCFGQFNIREPQEIANKLCDKRFCDQSVLMFCPGVAFNRDGYRIGYGKGYYDRYLKDLNHILKIGISYEKTLISESFEDKNDIPVNIIVTEKNIYLKKDL